MKVLALGAHPDDLEIFMFGTLAAFKAQGDDVVMAIATDGAKGGNLLPPAPGVSRVKDRAAMEAAAGRGGR